MEGPQILAPTPSAARGLQVFSTSSPSNQTTTKASLPVKLSGQWPLPHGAFKTLRFHSALKNPCKQCKGSPYRSNHLWTAVLCAALLIQGPRIAWLLQCSQKYLQADLQQLAPCSRQHQLWSSVIICDKSCCTEKRSQRNET